MENLLKDIEILREKVLETMRLLDVERKKSEAHELRALQSQDGFWDDRDKAVEISRQADELEKEVEEWESMQSEIRSLEELVAEVQHESEGGPSASSGRASESGSEQEFDDELRESYKQLLEKYNRLEFYVMFSHKYDVNNAVISIHAGTGGVDAQDWAEILERMFLRFVEKRGWKAEVLERTVANEAGIKSSSIHVKGRYAYGYLKSESGVHRLVRISPFDGDAARHTSFALVEVIPELPESEDIEITDSDIRIDVFKSSGPGGQGVNTTDSAIRITHSPSGIVVTCQNERSQHQNKETALKILKSKLYKLEEEKREAEERKLRGEAQKAEWGNQIRSYVIQPYKMVKDHRTKCETQDVDKVLDGDLGMFMEGYLRWNKEN